MFTVLLPSLSLRGKRRPRLMVSMRDMVVLVFTIKYVKRALPGRQRSKMDALPDQGGVTADVKQVYAIRMRKSKG